MHGDDRRRPGAADPVRRGLLAAVAGVAVLGAGPADRRVVRVRDGLLWGVDAAAPGVVAWLGVPFAAPPLGALRWRPPQPPARWRGVRRADRFGASACAPPADARSVYYRPVSSMGEDCLTLNVWAPPPAAGLRPVVVWIHGGAFVGGSSDQPLYDGANMAAQGVVFVSINYRLGILGFYAHPDLAAESPDGVSGNYGLMDQIAALRWIRDNISAFGGDPDNVTIMGQSAGAFSVGFHLVMPRSRGLFHRAVAESGAPMGRPSSFILLGERREMEASGLDFARDVGAPDLAALRRMDPMRLVEANSRAWRFYPMIDGRLVPAHPLVLITQGRHAAVPLVVGRNRDEGTLFPPLGGGDVEGLSAALASIYGAQAGMARRIFAADGPADAVRQGQRAFADIVFDWNSAALAVAMARSGRSPVYSYRFDYAGAVPADAEFAEGRGRDLGAFHGAEIGFALRTQAVRGPLSGEQAKLMQTLSGYWLNLARRGDPNGAGLPAWPRYAPGAPTILHVDGDGARPGPLDDRVRLELLGRAMDAPILDAA